MQEKSKQSARRKYDNEFKAEVLRMVSSGRPASEIARSLGIGENLIYKWRSRVNAPVVPQQTSISDVDKDLVKYVNNAIKAGYPDYLRKNLAQHSQESRYKLLEQKLVPILKEYYKSRNINKSVQEIRKDVKQLTDIERTAALTFLKSPDLMKLTREAIRQSGITGEETNALIAYLVYTSRKRETPLHLMCLGASGTGKTWLQEKVGELMPQEDKLEITTLSTNAFYYFGREELKHKLLLIEDLDGAEYVLYPLRELQSKKRISKTVTLKDSKGIMRTQTLTVESPVCVSGCTTREQLYDLHRLF